MKQTFYTATRMVIPSLIVGLLSTVAIAAPGDRVGGDRAGGRDGAVNVERGAGSERGGAGKAAPTAPAADSAVQRDTSARTGEGRGEKMRGNVENRRDRSDASDRPRRLDRADNPGRRFTNDDRRNRNWRGGRRYNWGPGVAFYFSDGYYYGECNWLKRRARETGNRIWLRRYAQCRNAV